jgi:hypothetical protein
MLLPMFTTDPPHPEPGDSPSAFVELQEGEPGDQTFSPPLPAIIDLEASGFGRNSYPIEVGFVLEDGRCGCTLIRPEPDWTHWDGSAQRAHGITPALLLDRGRSVVDVAHWLNAHLRGRQVYSDGWAHDYPWVSRIFDSANVVARFRVEHLRTLLDDQQALAWHDTLANVRRRHAQLRHRASADARHIRAALALTLRTAVRG